MFHLLSHTDGNGGETTLVDGYRAAMILHKTSPEDYKILKRAGVYAHASGNADSSIQPWKTFPVLGVDDAGKVAQIRWNATDRLTGSIEMWTNGEWYQAAK